MAKTHFLQTKAARTLCLAEVFRMSEIEAEAAFRKIRWSDTDGEPVCPSCGCIGAYPSRRVTGSPRFRCKAKECRKDFTITSGTLFASHKAPLRTYLAAIAVAMNEVKGKNALALSRDLGMSHKACWVLMHKVREAMAEEFKGRKIGGAGKVAETDGAYFGGYVRPANFKENRRDRRLAKNQSGKRQSLVVVRERNGNSVAAVFKSESAALGWIKSRINPGTVVNADEAETKEIRQIRCHALNIAFAAAMEGRWRKQFSASSTTDAGIAAFDLGTDVGDVHSFICARYVSSTRFIIPLRRALCWPSGVPLQIVSTSPTIAPAMIAWRSSLFCAATKLRS